VSDWTGCRKTQVLLLNNRNLQKFNKGRTFASLINVGWFKQLELLCIGMFIDCTQIKYLKNIKFILNLIYI
jgi:muramoyltetrapeptide carboxypeptidase LdcA involved in peptidoglycan recycling